VLCAHCGHETMLIVHGTRATCLWCYPDHPYDKENPVKLKVPSKSEGGDFELAPDGTHAAVLVDVIDLGVVDVPVFGKAGEVEKVHQVKLAFQIAENMSSGKPFLISTWGMRVSLHDKAKLRKVLETLNGKPFDVDQEIDPEAFIGCQCLLEVVHKKNADGTRTYANIGNVARAMKGMAVLTPRDYVRVKDRPAKDDEITNPNFDADDSIPF
jgi:hypothetical protein